MMGCIEDVYVADLHVLVWGLITDSHVPPETKLGEYVDLQRRLVFRIREFIL